VNEDDAGDVQSALKVFRCRAGRRSSVGNNLVDYCCERYKQIKRMKWIHKKAQTLRKLGVFHRHCPHKHAQTNGQKAFSLSVAGSGLLFPVLQQCCGWNRTVEQMPARQLERAAQGERVRISKSSIQQWQDESRELRDRDNNNSVLKSWQILNASGILSS